MISLEELRRIRLLNQLESGELESLSAVLTRKRAAKGGFILHAEDPGPSLYFILKGKVKITLQSNDGKEVVLASLQEGDFFGEIAVLTGDDRSANVVAVVDCELLILPREEFLKHLHGNTGLILAMCLELAMRLRGASSKIGDLALYDVYRRVARTLRSLSHPVDRDGNQILVIDERPTHQDLSAMVGTSREMVTRALKSLEEDGFIHTEGKRIELKGVPE